MASLIGVLDCDLRHVGRWSKVEGGSMFLISMETLASLLEVQDETGDEASVEVVRGAEGEFITDPDINGGTQAIAEA